MEDLLYEAASVRRFAGLRLTGALPDESAILHFRHLLERHQLGQGLFAEIKDHLEEPGVRLREGTIVDARTGVAHSLSATSANVYDVTAAHRLLHGGEEQTWGDAGYTGVQRRPENLEFDVDWQVAMKPGQRRKLEPDSPEALAEKDKASIRAKVEHPFLDAKQLFGYAKVRYRGLAKNTERMARPLGRSILKRAQTFMAG